MSDHYSLAYCLWWASGEEATEDDCNTNRLPLYATEQLGLTEAAQGKYGRYHQLTDVGRVVHEQVNNGRKPGRYAR